MGPTFFLLLASLSGQCGRQLADLRHRQFVPSAQGLDRQGDKLYPLAPVVLQGPPVLPGDSHLQGVAGAGSCSYQGGSLEGVALLQQSNLPSI